MSKLYWWKDALASALPCSLLCQCGTPRGISHAGLPATLREGMGITACAGLHPLCCCAVEPWLATHPGGPVLVHCVCALVIGTSN